MPRPSRFRFSKRTSPVARLALYLMAFIRATLVVLCRGQNGAAVLTEYPRGRSKILVFLSATKRNQLRSVHFDPLLLEAILKVCFFGAHFLKILVFSLLEEDEDSCNKCAQSFHTLPYIPPLFFRCAMSNFLLCAWFFKLKRRPTR